MKHTVRVPLRAENPGTPQPSRTRDVGLGREVVPFAGR
jgi:hypothetical protein